MKKDNLQAGLLNIAIAIILVASGLSWAANTPWWWNNPQGYAQFHQTASTGVIENNTVIPPGHAQLMTVQYDVPNEYHELLAKRVWVQLEWTVVTGTGEVILAGAGAPSAMWLNDAGSCPASPRDPYSVPPDGQGPLVNETAFTPVHGYADGLEFSLNIPVQPACERLVFNFVLDPDTRIEYRIEAQTVCLEMDWADAPDDPQYPNDYPTLFSSDGARHVISPRFLFGALEDSEVDGQPTANADGDDNNSTDDEDGLSASPLMLVVGQLPSVTISVLAAPGQNFSVTGWIDLNNDAVWDNITEFASANGVGTGSPADVTLNFANAPVSAAALTFARFRLASNLVEISNPTGMAYDGEVEDYPVIIEEREPDLDFGDVPGNGYNYPVMFEQDGGRHVIIPDFYLGSLVDMDTNGQATGDADGDDLDIDGDDEDALAADPLVLTVGAIPSVNLPVVAPNGQAFTVSGWIDLNDDGDWNDADEFVQTAGVGLGGPVNIVLNFPAAPVAPTTRTYARFRLCTEAGYINTPAGLAIDGEVEDYTVIIEEAPPELDFGDAPDQPYPTLLINNGARHIIVPAFFMGALIDLDPDGQQTANADGDDLDLDGDDEDSFAAGPILMTVGIVPNITIPVTVPIGVIFSLSGWIDFDASGVWGDAAGEFITVNGVGTGVSINVPLNFPAPPTAQSLTFARFRLSTDTTAIAVPFGPAPDGEVEDYPVIIEEAPPEIDFGDAPDPGYPSLLASDGARHAILPGLQMGLVLDGDPDSHQLGGNAGGDDGDDANDDDDGLDASQLIFTENQSRSINVNVNTPANLTVYASAWVDFNGDQTWQNSEQATGFWTGFGAGIINLNFPVVPPGSAAATSGHSYARFRISTNEASIAIPTGAALDGEVEDYPVDILVPVELTSFTAVFASNTVRLDWATQSESENLGFHIYRATSSDGNYTRINATMIPGAGTSPKAHYYNYVDQSIQPGVTYYYKLADVTYNGVLTMHGPLTVQTAPQNYGLEQNYPNPFNPETRINFKMMETGAVELGIYNLRGQQVRNLVSDQRAAGEHSVIWDGRNDSGQSMPSGTYLYKVRINGFEETKKMELVK